MLSTRKAAANSACTPCSAKEKPCYAKNIERNIKDKRVDKSWFVNEVHTKISISTKAELSA